MQGLNWSGGGSDAVVVENSCKWFSDTFMYGKTAKPFLGSGGSVHLKNIPTNSSGEGTTSEVDFFFKMFDIVADG